MKSSSLNPRRHLAPLLLVSASLLGGALLSGCAGLVVGGAVVGGLMVTDRRTSGAQVEDQAIELKAINRIQTVLGERGHVNITSYNRMALLTAAAVVAIFEHHWGWSGETLAGSLALIAIGAALTAAARTGRLAARLKNGTP